MGDPNPPPTSPPATKQPPPLWALVVATWFFAGKSPKAPGTVGSLFSLVLWAPLVFLDVPWWGIAAATAAVFAVGTLAANEIVRSLGREDPQLVVVDEVAGMGVTLTLAPGGTTGASIIALVLGFALFRLFDIWKPWPVRLADRKLHGGFGVMLDDVVAGLYALPCLWALDTYVVPRVLAAFN